MSSLDRQLVKVIRGYRTEFTTANPLLSLGELGIEIDTGQCKLGDGTTRWSSLKYVGDASTAINYATITNYIVQDTLFRSQYARITNKRAGTYVKVPQCTSSTTTMTQDTVRWVPFYVTAAGTLDRIGAEVTGGVVGSTFRLGVYADDGTFRPNLTAGPLAGNATIDGNTVAPQEITVSLAVTPGWYWACGVAQGGNPTMRCVSTPLYGAGLAYFDFGTSVPSGGGNLYAWILTGISGSLPTSGTLSLGGTAPMLWVRIS